MSLVDFVHAVITGLETAGTWALWWCATTATVLALVVGCRAGAAIARRHHSRRGIRRLEHYANHPAHRPREEKP